MYNEPGKTHLALITDRAGITKTYEAVTQYCGWSPIEAGKTMGLFPYGKDNPAIPPLFDDTSIAPLANRNIVVPTYPNGAVINTGLFGFLDQHNSDDVTLLENRRDLAYACQTQTQAQVVKLIRQAVDMSDSKNVVLSGGYGLNCVANYHYLQALKDEGINFYVEPVSNDAGTAIGAALMYWYSLTGSTTPGVHNTLYLGPKHTYTTEQVVEIAFQPGVEIQDATYSDIVELLTKKNIVTMFQGSSENGPRALGNRSVLFDPRFEDGKDFVKFCISC
jgi:carbamoyltransferase